MTFSLRPYQTHATDAALDFLMGIDFPAQMA